MVVPSSFSWVRSCITSSPLAVSRLPVGSSARISLGRATTARAMATRCCWPPESCDGMWRARWPIFIRSRASPARFLRSPAGHVGVIEQRQLDILRHIQFVDQIEALEDEADGALAQVRKLRLRNSRRCSAPSNQYSPAAGRIQHAHDVEEGGLAAARRPHHRDELAVAHLQVHVAQRGGLDLVGAIDFGQILQGDHVVLTRCCIGFSNSTRSIF